MIEFGGIQLLAIRVASAPPALRAALVLSFDEREILLATAARQFHELVIVSDNDKLELYSTDSSRQAVFATALKFLAKRVSGCSKFERVGANQLGGAAAVRHLFEAVTGLNGAPLTQNAVELERAVEQAGAHGTMGCELEALFRFAHRASVRGRVELAAGGQLETGELANPSLERIVEEELTAYQCWCAEQAQRLSAHSLPEYLDFGAEEEGSVVRLKAKASFPALQRLTG